MSNVCLYFVEMYLLLLVDASVKDTNDNIPDSSEYRGQHNPLISEL